MRHLQIVLVALTFGLFSTAARAEPVRLEALLTTTESISLGFKDNERHFVTLLKREGKGAGSGVFEGAKVAEYGLHDVVNGDTAQATGYLEVVTGSGDAAYLRWELRAHFVSGSDGGTKLINGGTWELAGGTGTFAGRRGVGSMRIEFPSKTERLYIFEGDISRNP